MTSQDALIAYFVETSGITSPTQVAERLGVPVETARKWMRRYRMMRSNPTGQISPVGDIDRSNPPKPVKSDRSNPPSPRARAYKESPTEIVISSKLASNAHASENEIEGLNGSTAMYVELLAGWLSEWAPDHEAATRILRGNVDLYGADKVRAGMLELETMIAAGEKPRNLAKAFPAFIKNANPSARPRTKADKAEVATLNALVSPQRAAPLQPVLEEWLP